MIRRAFLAVAVASSLALASSVTPASAAKPPPTWDGLVRVTSKRVDLAYLAPNADFRGYTKVMLDPTEVAFRKDWQRDYNNTTMGLSGRISNSEIQKVIEDAKQGADGIFAKAYADGGYPVVTEPGPDVLRVRVGIINVSVSAPERRTAGRSYSFANEAGEATYVVEVRDSTTGAILGRAVDRRIAGDTTIGQRNRVTNTADFRILAKSWAKNSVKGLNELKALSPINAEGMKKK